MYNHSTINESDKEKILEMYYGQQSYAFDNYLTIDGRYFIKNDELFDLYEGIEMGNIFSLKNISILLENVKLKNSLITEEIKSIISNTKSETFLLFETKSKLLNYKKLLIEQNDEEQIGTQSGSRLVEWFLKIARKLKKALYSIGGLAVDALLVASGIGKTVQWIPWAICMALDIYQWTSGNYGTDTEFRDSSTFWKLLSIGFSMMGMLTTGVIAKGARKLFSPIKALKSEAQIANWVSKTPNAKKMLTTMNNGLSSVGSKFSQASSFISKKFPKLGGWFSGLTKGIGTFTKTISNFLGRILNVPQKIGTAIQNTKTGTKLLGKAGEAGSKDLGKGLRAGAIVGALSAGLPALVTKLSSGNVNQIETDTLKLATNKLDDRLNKAF